MPNKAVLFDRDGTLNIDTGYLHKREEFRWTPEAPLALVWLKQHGYDIYVITNQSGIARGYFTLEDMQSLHQFMNDDLSHKGVEIKKFYFCPHYKEGKVQEYAVDCECRKPKPGLVLQCLKENNLAPENCVMIGDMPKDVECAEAAGIKGYQYQGGSLLEFVKKIGL
ncbi:MAG: HAD family hydrolase [Acidaminococcaceae bacterium]|nr:HAD family hydrolase [Acidaminococcaceae bacterium]MDO4935387.1 HAD family hydrolase [Phascolarctobacterium sp.]